MYVYVGDIYDKITLQSKSCLPNRRRRNGCSLPLQDSHCLRVFHILFVFAMPLLYVLRDKSIIYHTSGRAIEVLFDGTQQKDNWRGGG